MFAWVNIDHDLAVILDRCKSQTFSYLDRLKQKAD